MVDTPMNISFRNVATALNELPIKHRQHMMHALKTLTWAVLQGAATWEV